MRAPTVQQVTNRFAAIWPELKQMVGSKLTASEVLAICSKVASVSLPKSKKMAQPQKEALYRSCEHLLNKEATEDLLKSNIYRLIANWHFVMDAMEIPQWDGSRESSDAVFIGIGGRAVAKSGRAKYDVKIKLKTGLCAGIILWVTLSEQQLYNFVDHVAGTADYHCAVEEVAGMELRAVVEMVGTVAFLRQWTCTAAQKQHNKELSDARTDIRRCRKNIPCNTCKCTIYQCPLAVWAPKERKENA